MPRTRTILTAVAAATALAAGAASAVEPVDGVVRTAEDATGANVPDGGSSVVGGIGRANGRSAVVGLVTIQFQSFLDAPHYVLSGALADPSQWSCSGGGTGAAYTVTCLPVPLVLPVTYHCDVLHADAFTTSTAASARTSLDCDSDGVPEARTDTVTGPAGSDLVWAVDTRPVTAFTCTVDHGAPDYTGRCGDPGLVGVE